MKLIGNLIWFIFGGLEMAIGWCIVGAIAALTIVGLPWARACFVIAKFTLWPFGKVAINRKELTGKDDIGTSSLGTVGNIMWFIFAGAWLAIGHLIAAFVCILTIIGIPFAIQHFKLAGIAVAPIGKAIVSK